MNMLYRSLMAAMLAVSLVGGSRAADAPVSGKLVETMDAGGYTYALLDTGTDKVWIAAYPFKAAAGEKVTVTGGMEMQNFESPSLKRKFDRIYFASGVTVGTNAPAASALPSGHPPIGGSGHGVMVARPQAGSGTDGTVVETMDVGNYTYVRVKPAGGKEIWAAASQVPVKVGDQVTVPEGQLMTDFHSAKLNRTFAEIYFVNELKVHKPGVKAPVPAVP